MKYLATFFLLILSNFCFGQFNETIRTGRPGQAIGAFTVGKNVLQFQQGLDYYSTAEINPPKEFVFNNVVRYEISETVELSALVDYQYKESGFGTTARTLEGISN